MVENGLEREARETGRVYSQCELGRFAPERGVAGVTPKRGREPFEGLVNGGIKVGGGTSRV